MSLDLQLTGTVVGYDPGGNGKHGVARLRVVDGRVDFLESMTLRTAEDVLEWIAAIDTLLAIGVDTLATWSTAESGWRAADLFLREQYPEVAKSVIPANSLYGAMTLSGMSVVLSCRRENQDLSISETHPKVLYWALTGTQYDYESNPRGMDKELAGWLGVELETSNDHEWDATVSAYAAWQGISGDWTRDLMSLEIDPDDGRRLSPAGRVNYWWPCN